MCGRDACRGATTSSNLLKRAGGWWHRNARMYMKTHKKSAASSHTHTPPRHETLIYETWHDDIGSGNTSALRRRIHCKRKGRVVYLRVLCNVCGGWLCVRSHKFHSVTCLVIRNSSTRNSSTKPCGQISQCNLLKGFVLPTTFVRARTWCINGSSSNRGFDSCSTVSCNSIHLKKDPGVG